MNDPTYAAGLVGHAIDLGLDPGIAWLHIVSDVAIAIAFATIPILIVAIPALMTLSSRREVQRVRRLEQELNKTKRAELEFRETNEELEARVAARTRELARSNQELEQFAYVASHDLREPLRMVKSYAELLSRRYQGKLDSTADEYLAYITEGADRMRALIHDLLEYSRVDGRASPEDTDAEQCLRLARQNLDVAIEHSGAVVTHDDLPSVRCTPTQLVQVFQNLLDNAIKYRNDAVPRVHVGAEVRGKEIVISVRDNGIGFDPGHTDRVFGMFQRLHPRGIYPGTGMGLALCKKIMETNGGRIWVEAEPLAGCVFHFALPRCDAPREVADA